VWYQLHTARGSQRITRVKEGAQAGQAPRPLRLQGVELNGNGWHRRARVVDDGVGCYDVGGGVYGDGVPALGDVPFCVCGAIRGGGGGVDEGFPEDVDWGLGSGGAATY
jgi:hypothetical protein